jgi:hypothetical protein
MKESKAFSATSTDSFPAFKVSIPEKTDHRHYCSSCCAYWDHEDRKCANRGYAMSCPGCLQAFSGLGMQ